MANETSVTIWIERLGEGNSQAAEELWERYYSRLVHLARKRMMGLNRNISDEEDLALSAFQSFFDGVGHNRFPRLNDRSDLWQILVMLTAQKVADQHAYENRLKRGGGPQGKAKAESLTIAEIVGPEPDPAFAAELVEEFRARLSDLPNNEVRTIAIHKFDGFTNEEIAEKVGCSARTVERRIRLIRKMWAPEEETA